MRGEVDEREQTRLQARVYCLAMPRKTAFPAATRPREPSLSGIWAVVNNAWEMKEWQRPSSAGGNSNRLIGWVRPRRGGLMASMDTLAWCAWRSDQGEARKVGALSFRDAAESPKTADRC